MTDTVAPPPRELVSAALDCQIASWLAQLLGPARPRRFSKMTSSGNAKYFDMAGQLDQAMLLDHARGRSTYAATLDQAGYARAGVIELDKGGRAAVVAAMQAAQQLGLVVDAFLQDDGHDHQGGHVWFLYDDWYPVADILAQLDQVLRLAGLPANTELWPRDKANNRGSDQGIRLPFGKHLRNQTRGELLDQAGQIIALDTDLATGFSLVEQLPTNAAPPVSKPDRNRIDQASDKAHYPKSHHVATCPDTPAARARGRIDTLAIFASARARFNAEHTWSDLLSKAGGHETRDGWACNCGWKHSNATQIAVTSQDKIVSFTPNCTWAPPKGSGRALDKFGFWCDQEHSGNYRAAAEAAARQYGLWLEPEQPRAAPLPEKAPELLDTRDEAERFSTQHASAFDTDYVLTPAELERRAAEAQRKRVARHAHAPETIADVRLRAERDEDLTKADRAVLEALLMIAGDRGWCRPSKEQIAKISGVPLGTVKRAMFSAEAGGRLEGRYFTSQGKGGKGGAKLTAIRTFLCGSNSAELIHKTHDIYDLIPESRASERGAEKAELLERLSFASYLRNLAAELGEVLDLAELSARPMTELEQLEARLLVQLADLDQAALGYPMVAGIPHGSANFSADGACYNPAADWTAGGVLDLSQWRDPLELRTRAAGDVSDQAEPAQLLDQAPEPEPLIRCAPTEPNAAREYWALKNKKPINFKQSRWIAYRLAELEIWLPASEAPTVEPRPLSPDRAAPIRRRSRVAPEISAPKAAGQLELELETRSTSAGGFVRALVESSPPLTSSECLGVQLTLECGTLVKRGPITAAESEAPHGRVSAGRI